MHNRYHNNATLLQSMVLTYFEDCKAQTNHPTPAGMALHLDYDTSGKYLQDVRNDPPDPKIGPEALSFLRRSATMLEQYYTENGLKDLLPPAFTKLLLSAYFEINEKVVKREEHDQTITIVWEGGSSGILPPPPKPSDVIDLDNSYIGDIEL